MVQNIEDLEDITDALHHHRFGPWLMKEHAVCCMPCNVLVCVRALATCASISPDDASCTRMHIQHAARSTRALLFKGVFLQQHLIAVPCCHYSCCPRGEPIDRKRFRELLISTLGNRAMTPTYIDFLWHCFDRCVVLRTPCMCVYTYMHTRVSYYVPRLVQHVIHCYYWARLVCLSGLGARPPVHGMHAWPAPGQLCCIVSLVCC